MVSYRAVTASTAALFCVTVVEAADLPIVADMPVTVEVSPLFSVTGYVGYLSGESREQLYNAEGKKVSQLNWQIDNAVIAGGGVSFRPNDWLTLRADGWTTISSDSTMDDYDWLKPGRSDWSHWSHHPKTDLTTAYQLDAGVAARFVEIDGFSFSFLAGFRFLKMKWESYNGSYIYSSSQGFRDVTGSFSGNVIDYEQSWRTPYIGISATYETESFRLTGEIIGSPIVSLSDRDHHVLRDLLFKGEYDRTSMVAVSLSAEIDLSDTWTLFGKVEYQKYWKDKSDFLVHDLGSGISTKYSDIFGADHDSFTLKIGVKASF